MDEARNNVEKEKKRWNKMKEFFFVLVFFITIFKFTSQTLIAFHVFYNKYTTQIHSYTYNSICRFTRINDAQIERFFFYYNVNGLYNSSSKCWRKSTRKESYRSAYILLVSIPAHTRARAHTSAPRARY